MSTRVIQPGTTPKAGRSGRFLGMAAVGLAVVIAGGFVFAANQRSEDTVSRVEAVLSQPAFQAESQRLQGLADYWIARDPDNYPTELKRLLAMIEKVNAESHPAFNIEKYKLEQAGQIGSSANSAPQGVLQQRLAHEFLEEQRTSGDTRQGNPMEGQAE
ncbi:MAG: hypothetical protein ACRDZM_08175 [Acidimicrobiia bacterium]